MELVIDAGNTRVKLGLFNQNDLVEKLVLDSLSQEAIDGVFNQYTITSIIYSSVSSEQELNYHIPPKVSVLTFNHQTRVPFKNLYETPETLGLDRLAGVAGALALFPNEDVLVIDAGSCITYDFVDEQGQYFGGGISPGLEMRFKSLHTFTGRLPLVKKSDLSSLVGNSTERAIVSGVQNGICFEVDQFIEAMKVQYPSLRVVLTGGDLPFFENRLKNTIFAASDLVLVGLHKILKINA